MTNIPVLVVNDSVASSELQQKFLDSPFDIHHFKHPSELNGLGSSRFEIAIVDLEAATKKGSSLIEYLIESMPDIRCVAAVEHPDIASVQRAMKLGCRSYLATPLSSDAIFKVVGEVARASSLLSLSDRELQLRLSRLIRARRLQQQLTLTEMARRAGLSKSQLSQIELAKSWPSFPTLNRISAVLDQRFSQLFKGVEQE